MSLVRIVSRFGLGAVVIASSVGSLVGVAQAAEKKGEVPSYYGPQPSTEAIDLTMYARIREEGLKHSHVMQFGAALNEGIGPRLTGSPNMAKANAWTRDTLDEDWAGERAPGGLGRVRDGMAADQYVGENGVARPGAAVGAGFAVVSRDEGRGGKPGAVSGEVYVNRAG